MKILKTPEEVAEFINSVPYSSLDVSGTIEDGETWVVVTVRPLNSEFTYKLETVKLALEQGLIKDKD
jgi:hypothetical protein